MTAPPADHAALGYHYLERALSAEAELDAMAATYRQLAAQHERLQRALDDAHWCLQRGEWQAAKGAVAAETGEQT